MSAENVKSWTAERGKSWVRMHYIQAQSIKPLHIAPSFQDFRTGRSYADANTYLRKTVTQSTQRSQQRRFPRQCPVFLWQRRTSIIISSRSSRWKFIRCIYVVLLLCLTFSVWFSTIKIVRRFVGVSNEFVSEQINKIRIPLYVLFQQQQQTNRFFSHRNIYASCMSMCVADSQNRFYTFK